MIKGFTILEMLVGMVLTAIVLAAGFYGYHLINLQLSLLQSNQEKIMDTQSFLNLLQKDIQEANYIYRIESEQKLRLVYNDSETIYDFQDKLSLRKLTDKQDTIPLPCKIILPIEIHSYENSNLMEHLELELIIFGKAERFTFNKKYSSEDYFNQLKQ